MKQLLILLVATSLSAPALAQHSGHHMPGHTMPMPKAKPKAAAPKPAAPKPVARKPVAKPNPKAAKARPAAGTKRKAAASPESRKAAPRRAPTPPVPAADPHAGHQMGKTADPHAGHHLPAAANRAGSEAAPKGEGAHSSHQGPAIAPPTRSTDPHAGHQMPHTNVDPHAGHQMPAVPPPASADPHAGHQMPQPLPPETGRDAHLGHDVGAAALSPQAPPVAPPPPAAFLGPEHAADLVYGDERMARAREELYEEHGSIETYKILVDQLEAKIRNGRDGYAWDGQAWYGGDINKLWIKTEGEGAFGETVESAEVQALWSRAIDPWFDLQLGVRHDFRPDPERTHLVLGVQGLAPYWFEVDVAAFVSDKGDVSTRAEAEYDLRLTQKFILQPRVEFDLALQDVPEIGIGSGLSTAELGARLRYEVRPEFAPYVGIEYERAFGDTADFRRTAGEEAGGWSLLVGLRTWF